MAQAPASEAVRKQQGRPAASEPPLKPKKDVLASRRSRFAKGSTSVDPMELLTSPSRGVDSVVTPAMIGLHETVSAGKATYVEVWLTQTIRCERTKQVQGVSLGKDSRTQHTVPALFHATEATLHSSSCRHAHSTSGDECVCKAEGTAGQSAKCLVIGSQTTRGDRFCQPAGRNGSGRYVPKPNECMNFLSCLR